MRKTELRQQDILKLIEGLDISPTMYKNATDKYKAVGTYLQEQGVGNLKKRIMIWILFVVLES